MSTPPGWYPNPGVNDGRLRYWDGEKWTEHYAHRRPVAPTPTGPVGRMDWIFGRNRVANKRNLTLIAWVVGVIVAVGIVGAVTGKDDPNDSTAEPSGSTRDSEADKAALVARAEKIVADKLPDIPIWKGTTVKGTYVNETEVCVDRTYGPHGGVEGKGGNAGFVVITFPEGTTSEPKEGTCANPAPEPIDWQSKIEGKVKDRLGDSNRDDAKRVASVAYLDGVNAPLVTWAINENLTEGLTKKGAMKDVADMLEVLQQLHKDGMPLKGATFEGTYSLVDQLGNVSEDRVVLVRYSRATIKAINFDNFVFTNVYDVADSVWLHPAFED